MSSRREFGAGQDRPDTHGGYLIIHVPYSTVSIAALPSGNIGPITITIEKIDAGNG